MTVDTVEENIRNVRNAIIEAATLCGRPPEAIRLVAVTKTMPAEIVRKASRAGICTFGENYIQEAKDKIAAVQATGISWHFIGHLQTNKAGLAVRLFDLIHTVDSIRLSSALNRAAEAIGKKQAILLQVNIAGESTKSGADPGNLLCLACEIGKYPHLSIKGLMALPPFTANPEQARPCFRALAELGRRIDQAAIPGVSMEELSMGMSHDFAVAVTEGATLVRVGTAIFGERK